MENMVAKRLDLKKCCFFVLSGVSNPLGESLAVEMCRHFQPGSVVLLIDSSLQLLQEFKKKIQLQLESKLSIKVACTSSRNQPVRETIWFREKLEEAIEPYGATYFELALIVHNEGYGATNDLMEPQDPQRWLSYVQRNLYAVVSLSQAFLKVSPLDGVQKLVVNVTSSLPVQPLIYSSLNCSCKQARGMYFRAMAEGEGREHTNIAVLNYSPGIMETHAATVDLKGNVVGVGDLGVDKRLVPRATPLHSTLKLVNILEQMTFCSGHDIDYYDTYNL